MTILYPTQRTLFDVFSPQSPFSKPKAQNAGSSTTRRAPFMAWSVAEDAKSKAGQLSDEAVKEYEKASAKVQQKGGQLELYSAKYFAACTFGGLLACGVTHTAVTPLDLVKCRRQVDSKLYKGNFEAWGKIMRSEGFRGIFTGWGPTFWGYSVQGALKYGGYEYFKYLYADLAGEENAKKYKTSLYLAASALYKGLYPLWGRQIPYTMMKFASFETIVAAMYNYLPGEKSDYGTGAQTAVAFTGGYLAGILCAIVSHPADVMVSKLNANRQPGEAFGAAMGRIYKDIGFMGLWNGLPVRIVMIGTLTGLQWMIYDSFKIYMGFPTTGGPEPEKKKAEA
ncbi:MAG: hypothetical protein Q9227_002464 [Pyrenula ochraceoflavens]